jgi:hypothetical protein
VRLVSLVAANRRLAILRRCGKISAGRTAAAARGARQALSAEFNSEAQRRSRQMVLRSMDGAYSDGGSQLTVGGVFTPSDQVWE